MPGECIGRCDQLQLAAVALDVVVELLDQANPLAVEVFDLGDIDNDSGPVLDSAFQLVLHLVRVRKIDLTAESYEKRAVQLLVADRKELIAHVGGRSITGSRKRTVVPVGVDSRLKSSVSSRMRPVPLPRSGPLCATER